MPLIGLHLNFGGGFPGGSVVKKKKIHLPINIGDLQETGVQILGQEDPLEKAMDTHSSILVWRIP